MKKLKTVLIIIIVTILLSFSITNIVQATTKKEVVLVIDPRAWRNNDRCY